MKKEVTRVRKVRKLSFQKIFNLMSAMFILACIIFYGSRFIKLYKENNHTEETKTLADNIKDNNKDNDNFKNINGTYYFNGKDVNNYIKYSNLTFRIIKVNTDNTITAISENSLTALASGENKEFKDSYLNMWLNNQNKENTGILENNLNNTNKYLTFTNTCNGKITKTKNITCDKKVEDTFITTPSLYDYINTGSEDSFMNNEEYFYLINTNDDKKIWYVNNNGGVTTSDGTDIMGIKPVITIKSTISLKDGDGSKDTPYTFEEEQGLLGSYVNLDNDIWRIYSVEEDNIKLSLNNYITQNNEPLTYIYSEKGYYHNDGAYGTLAYYLNHNYLNSLTYSDKINEVEYANGIYSNNTDYDYTKVLSTTVPTKVTVLSIGNIILNPISTNYFLSTGIEKESTLVYSMSNDFNLNTKISLTESKIVPVISIKKDLLKQGSGTKEDPWEVE